MKHLIKTLLFAVITVFMAFSVNAAQPNDVYFFVVPSGYDLESLSKTLGVETDFLSKYNPQAKDGIFAGMRMYVPATSVSEENLKKVDSAPTFAGGALESVCEYALSGGMNQTRPQSKSVGSDAERINSQPKQVPTRVKSLKTLKEFFSNAPKFKCPQTNTELVLSYGGADGFVVYVDGKRYGTFEVDIRDDRPSMALIGLPWLNGWGPAPMLLTLDGKNTNLALLPVQGEENLRYNSQGYLQHGRTGNTNWVSLSLSSEGISFTPVNYKPEPEIFWFIGFNK